jgi:hypothetical protein
MGLKNSHNLHDVIPIRSINNHDYLAREKFSNHTNKINHAPSSSRSRFEVILPHIIILFLSASDKLFLSTQKRSLSFFK